MVVTGEKPGLQVIKQRIMDIMDLQIIPSLKLKTIILTAAAFMKLTDILLP